MKLALPALTLVVLGWQASIPRVERVVPNDNRVAAGVLANGVLRLRLEVMQRTGIWKIQPLPIQVEP